MVVFMDDENEYKQAPDQPNKNDATLISVRDKALSILIPLLDELDDTPEHKFDITLAAIRSTDNPELLVKALSFAQQIENKSAKAQALIDIANEATVRLQLTEQ